MTDKPRAFNHQLDPTDRDHLRQHPLVLTWIANYQKDEWTRHADCPSCGWPHSPVVSCGWGATFGKARFGQEWAYVDTSNVAWTVTFAEKLKSLGFHWRHDVYVKRDGDTVTMSRVSYYNNSPSIKAWHIPVNEFASIMCAASVDG